MIRLLIERMVIGHETKERRKPHPPQETRRAESRYESIPELEEVGQGRGDQEGEVEKGEYGEDGWCGCGEE
jgi:hypothetical protein